MELTITDHAIDRYIERVYARATRAQARAEIEHAMRAPLFCCPAATTRLLLFGCINRVGYPFMAATDDAATRVETVGERWHWHEARQYWRHYMESKRGRVNVARSDRDTAVSPRAVGNL